MNVSGGKWQPKITTMVLLEYLVKKTVFIVTNRTDI